MRRRQRPELDELMIVNPGSPTATRAVVLRRVRTAHRVSKRGAEVPPEGDEDGRIAEVERRARGRFFLGADGALYEVIE